MNSATNWTVMVNGQTVCSNVGRKLAMLVWAEELRQANGGDRIEMFCGSEEFAKHVEAA